MTVKPQPIRDLEAIGHMLRTRRRALGLTQVQAAELVGVSARLWNETERGKRNQLGLETVLRMIQTLGMDLSITSRS